MRSGAMMRKRPIIYVGYSCFLHFGVMLVFFLKSRPALAHKIVSGIETQFPLIAVEKKQRQMSFIKKLRTDIYDNGKMFSCQKTVGHPIVFLQIKEKNLLLKTRYRKISSGISTYTKFTLTRTEKFDGWSNG